MRVGAKQLVEQAVHELFDGTAHARGLYGVTTGTQPAAPTMVLDDQADLV